MPDPDDELPIMQRFDRLLRAMVRRAPSGKIEGEDRTSDAEPSVGSEEFDIKDTYEAASSIAKSMIRSE